MGNCPAFLRVHLVTLLLMLLLLPGCTSMVPKEKLFPPLVNGQSGDSLKLLSIPLPVVAASPNEGVTTGALVAFLLHNKRDEIDSLIAPQINRNPNFGTTASLYGAFFPSRTETWELSLSKSSRVNENYELRFQDTAFRHRKLEVNAYLFRVVDGSSRFFGFGSGAETDGESNYANDEAGVNVSAAWRIGRHYQIAAGERYRRVRIRSGAADGLPYIRDRFTPLQVPGLDGFTAHAQRISLIYSTLNMPTMATFGGYVRLTAEVSSRFTGSQADYRHYEVDLRGYVPTEGERLVSTFRFMYNQTLGSDVPFLERSILGGETTLRGYGRNRFIDSSCLLINLEERIRLARWEIFGVNADWELAPFVDIGAVAERLSTLQRSDFVASPGVGIRAVVRPNVIGRLDMGFGREGPAVFVGLGYPF